MRLKGADSAVMGKRRSKPAHGEAPGVIVGAMTLKGEGKGPLPPLLGQYVELRERYPDYLMLFQVGDFYECFGEDAERLARALGLILTHKTSNTFITPMAGIPVRSADGYIERLLGQGVRVAVADQVEEASLADGLVRRDVTQLITPGTVVDEKLLRLDANYLAAVSANDGYGLALLDVSTGEFRGAHLYSKGALYDELSRYRPAEVLLAPELYDLEPTRESMSKRFSVMLSRGRFDLGAAQSVLAAQFGSVPPDLGEALISAAGAVLSYALETQRGELPQVTRFLRYDPGASMQLDEVAFSTLEIFHSALGSSTLFGAIDCTRTAPGRRLLKAWLRHPLLDEGLIERRLDAVEALVRDGVLRAEVRKTLHKMHDLERLAARLASARAGARDLAALGRSLSLLPQLKRLLLNRPEQALGSLLERLRELGEARQLIAAALVSDPPHKLGEGKLIQDGFDRELDGLRQGAEEARGWILGLERTERERTGIASLKVGFNQVFGYYLEITRAHYGQIPDDYHAVQTLKDRQRFTRPDLREKEREILRAEEAAKRRELAVFQNLRDGLRPCAQRLSELSAALAELDVYAGLAEVAARQGYSRPRLTGGQLRIKQGRHPVVERHHAFIANDLALSPEERLIILTGSNMSGKSTYLRQSALIALLAQIGSFVPAEEAELPIFDRIYTRIGAGDDIAGGRSTFMVEMEELSRILQGATARSLVLLDEIGRGTSTYDGLSLAWAASEYLHDRVRAYTLFATHYFELTGLAAKLSAARNHHVAAKEEAGGLIFYHQVLPGPASKAYGLEVAKLAGLPAKVLERARAVLTSLEASGGDVAPAVVEELMTIDVSRLSPLEALTLLHRLQERARGLVLEP